MSELGMVLLFVGISASFYFLGFYQGLSGGKTLGKLDALIERLKEPT